MLKRASCALAILLVCNVPLQATGASDTLDIDGAPVNATTPQRAFVRLVVAGVDRGSTLAIVSGRDILLLQSAAVDARIPFTAKASVVVDGTAYVSLAKLSPRTTFALDDATLTLAVYVDAAALGTTAYDVSDRRDGPALLAARPKSAFVNYFVSASEGGGASGYFETGVSAHDSLFYSNESIDGYGHAQRGQTYFAHDDVAHLRHEVAGDVSVGSEDALFGQVDVFGVGVKRQFSIDPYAYYFPTPSVAGVLATPGTADVYVDGLLAHSTPLGPGGFDLTNIPVTTGTSDVTVVVRDAAGHARTYDQTFFATNSLLKRGLTDYAYGAGLLRTADADSYDDLALAGSYRIGATDMSTLGGELSATAHRSQIGVTSDFKFGTLLVHASEAAGNFYSHAGTATNVAVDYRGGNNTFGFGATVRGAAFDYARSDIASDAPGGVGFAAPARFEVVGNASRQFGPHTSVMASYFHQTFDGQAAQTTALVTLSQQFHSTFLLATYSDTRSGGAPTRSFGISLSKQIGSRASLSIGDSVGSGAQRGFDFQQSAPSIDTGVAYGVQYDNGTSGSLLANAVVHAPLADIAAYAESDAGNAPRGSLQVSGGIVASDGHVLATRAVRDAFALVETQGVAGVPIVVDGRPAGRTNANGLLVIPSLASFSQSRISVQDTATPLGTEVERSDSFVAPGARGGSVASFKVRHVAYYVGSVGDWPNATLVLSYGVRLWRSALDELGGFYFENLEAGRYRATVRSGIRECTFTLVVPKTAAVANDLGAQTCAR